MTQETKELAQKILAINLAAREKVREHPLENWELFLGQTLDKIVDLCREQLEDKP